MLQHNYWLLSNRFKAPKSSINPKHCQDIAIICFDGMRLKEKTILFNYLLETFVIITHYNRYLIFIEFSIVSPSAFIIWFQSIQTICRIYQVFNIILFIPKRYLNFWPLFQVSFGHWLCSLKWNRTYKVRRI